MKVITLIAALLFSTITMAGPGHKHSHGHSHEAAMPKEKMSEVAQFHIARLVKAQKLDASWLEAKFDKTVMKKNEWLVTFNNEKGVKGKKLYIFLKKSGDFVAANFTGK
mgnify:CR=1 FL=1|tara:strand:- start:10594 stop:10920 length:327 start_codon:yes stop_codon:yes gene_type:complete